MSVRTGPCTWEVSYQQCEPPTAWNTLTEEQRAGWEEMATELLWRWTGRGLGLCSETIAPCDWSPGSVGSTFYGGQPAPLPGGRPWVPVLVGGQWYNLQCGACGLTCFCNAPPSVELPGPVDAISSVTIGGEVLDPTTYRIDNSRWLVRLDGWWPAARGDADTFSVTYMRGVSVPFGGRVAAGRLAVELWKASCKDSSCALPSRVQSITRQGVTVAVLDTFDDLDRGRTGIYLIDAWVASMTVPAPPSAVVSIDVPRSRRVTWQGV